MQEQTIFEMLGFLLTFVGLGFGYLAVCLRNRNERQNREFEHEERMKALELGRSLPSGVPWCSPGRLGFLIGVVGPGVVFGFAWLTTWETGYHEEVWKAAGMVGVMSVFCASLLVGVGLSRQSQTQITADAGMHKPSVEQDAYDVVSARG
ncbi:MAG: hypothetical protein ACP5XB_13205 [Isosphaeraceae bacterium]